MKLTTEDPLSYDDIWNKNILITPQYDFLPHGSFIDMICLYVGKEDSFSVTTIIQSMDARKNYLYSRWIHNMLNKPQQDQKATHRVDNRRIWLMQFACIVVRVFPSAVCCRNR